MAKQTAVEWLIDKIVQGRITQGLVTEGQLKEFQEWAEAFLQAKQMEKEQKQECWDTAHQAGRFEGKGIAEENWQTFEQYYNERYKNK